MPAFRNNLISCVISQVLVLISFVLSLSDTAGVHAELEKMTKSTKQTKRAHSDVNPNGPSSAS